MSKLYELQLPYSGATIAFAAPSNRDRHTVIKQFIDREKPGPSEIELLAGYCLKVVNGNPVDGKRFPHPGDRMLGWPLPDVQEFVGTFAEMFYRNTAEDAERMKATAKKLLYGDEPELTTTAAPSTSEQEPS